MSATFETISNGPGVGTGSFFQYLHICSIRCEGNHDLDVGLVIMVTGGKPPVT